MSHNQTLYSHKNEICYADIIDHTQLWGLRVYPLKNPVPHLVLQMAISIGINHGLLLICQRLGQPRIVSYIMTSLILSPSLLAKISYNLKEILLPSKSFTILKALANLGLLYATFIKALQVYPTPISHCRIKMLYLSFLVFLIPFMIGCALYIFLLKEGKTSYVIGIVSIYWGTIITSTGFATLAPILTNFKLLCTRFGQEALFVGLLNNFCSLVLINVATAMSASANDRNNINIVATCSILILMVLYTIFCCTAIKPAIMKITTSVPEGEKYSNFVVHMILFLVLACGLLTDYIGCHFIFGAYVIGRIIPPGYLAKTLIEKMEDCVDGVLMPLYFVVLGIGLDIFLVLLNFKYILVIILAVAIKVLCTLIIGLFCNLPLIHGFPLGILLNSKGLFPLVLLNIGHQRKILSRDSYTLLFITIFLSTILVEPIINIICKRIGKNTQSYDQRCLQGADFSKKLKLITCIHSIRNVRSIINLLEISNITIEYPASVHVTHLIELLGHAPAMLVEHESQGSFFWNLGSKLFCDRGRAESDRIIKEFIEYKDQHDISTSSLKFYTVVSPIDTMHEDVCSLVEDKHASLIILPFHKQQGVDGKLEETNIEFGGVNQKVLDLSPCSVALLVDRGLRMNSMSSSSESYSDDGQGCEPIQIAMIYIGGGDDREALTYAWRMGGHPCVYLTVIRFLEGEQLRDADQPIDYLNFCGGDEKIEKFTTSAKKAKEIKDDNEFLMDFQEQTSHDRSICYLEKYINCVGEIIISLREMRHDFDLYIVGKGQSRLSFLTIGLVKWSEFKELGSIGEILVTSDFTSAASVLVMQQHANKLTKKNIVAKSNEKEKVTIISS